MPVTRSRAASLSRRDDANDAFPGLSRPNTPPAASANQDGDDAFSSPRADANATFSSENVATIIASLQRSQTEAFRELLNSVSRANASIPESLALLGHNTLARCKATFSGRPKESVEAFIDAIEAYSDCAQVSDSNILRGLAYLFKDEAATWWQGIKYSVSSWREARENLISAYQGSTIMCYECNSATDSTCLDGKLPDNLLRNCSDHDRGVTHTLCRKIVQHVDYGVNGRLPESRVIRSCGWDETKYKGQCYHRAGYGGRQEVCSCVTDLCNGVQDTRASITGLLVTTALIAIGTVICL